MKKILLVLLAVFIIGCSKNTEKPQEVYSKEDILKEQAIELYKDQKNDSNEWYYVTPLQSVISNIKHKELFDGCDLTKASIVYTSIETSEGYRVYSKLDFVCNGTMTIYTYNGLFEGEPISTTTKPYNE